MKIAIWLVLATLPSSCFLMHRITYEFTGTIINAADQRSISDVRVVATCTETVLEAQHETLSTQDGEFRLSGHVSGALDDCQLNFHHAGFKPKTVILKPARDLPAGALYTRTWRLQIELEPL